MRLGTCCVVEGTGCKAYPTEGDRGKSGPVVECYSCGEDVCTNCSARVEYFGYGKQRICFRCIHEQTKGTPEEERGELLIDYHVNRDAYHSIWKERLDILLENERKTRRFKHKHAEAILDLEHHKNNRPRSRPPRLWIGGSRYATKVRSYNL